MRPPITRNMATARMIRFLRRLRRASGEYFRSGGGARTGGVSETGRDAFSSAILFSWEILLHSALTGAHSANERNLREIVLIQTGDVLLMGVGNRLLRLHDL